MSLKNPYELPTDKLEKEKPVQYDLFKDYYRGNKGKPCSDWDWYAWYSKHDNYVFTEGKQGKEIFKFFNKEVEHDCNVPEPNITSFIIVGAILLIIAKRGYV